ncbi:MAG: amidohydrolase family protein [Chthonomonadales bacterium]
MATRVFDVHSYLGGSVIPGMAATGKSVVAQMNERGVETSLLFSSHARAVDPTAGNRILKANLEQSPDLYGCLVTHFNRMESSVTVMRELMSNRKFLGMAIVGSHPNEPIDKLLADEIINAYRRYSKPLFLFANNADMVHAALEIARSYMMIKVVLLGMGGLDWRTAIAAALSSTNLVLETSGVLDRSKLTAAVEAIGTHRILFGSGAPHVDQSVALGLIEDSHLSDDVRRRILWDNAVKLFGLTPET